jgi:hypothetical protein
VSNELAEYFLLRILEGAPAIHKRHVPVRDELPAPVLKLLRQITGAANGTSNTPPLVQISTAYGVLTLEAKWLMPAGTHPADAARNPKGYLIAVTIALHEHAIAHAARGLCHVRGFYLSIGRGALSPHVYISMP